jgi:hypothetical protein
VGHPEVGLGVLPGKVEGFGLLLILLLLTLAAATARPPSLRLPDLRSDTGLVTILTVATTVGLLLYAAGGSSLFLPRNLSGSLPAFAVLMGLVIVALTRSLPARAGLGAVLAMITLLGLNALDNSGDDYRRVPYRQAAQYVDDIAASQDPIVEVPLGLALSPDKRLRPTTLNQYFRRPRSVYRSGPGAALAWRQLARGRSVYEVTTANFVNSKLIASQPGGSSAGPDLLRRADLLGGPQGRAVVRRRTEFAGLIRVAAIQYKGLVTGRILRHGAEREISWSFGRHVTVSAGSEPGAITIMTPSGGPLLIAGWAVDAASRSPVDWFLFFSGDRLFAVSGGGGARPDIAKIYGSRALLSGFATGSTPAPSDHASIKVFAVSGSRASELPLSRSARRALNRR